MSYNERLNKLIDDSGLKIITISQRCKQQGVDVNPSYISILKNSPDKVASPQVSRAIAKACGAKDPDILVIENYIDKAPDEIKKVFEVMKTVIAEAGLSLLSNDMSDIEKKAIADNISNMQVADFISYVNSQDVGKYKKMYNSNNMQAVVKDGGVSFVAKLSEPQGFPIIDDTMAPLLCKGDKVNIYVYSSADEIKDNDIVAYTENTNKNNIIFRKCMISDDEITMFPLSAKAHITKYKFKDKKINILGKVTRFIRNV